MTRMGLQIGYLVKAQVATTEEDESMVIPDNIRYTKAVPRASMVFAPVVRSLEMRSMAEDAHDIPSKHDVSLAKETISVINSLCPEGPENIEASNDGHRHKGEAVGFSLLSP